MKKLYIEGGGGQAAVLASTTLNIATAKAESTAGQFGIQSGQSAAPPGHGALTLGNP